ncbi:MAG TPA: mannose-6-phosphate isomerase, class I [Micromonosporaceae bacterium]|nr:mannose-6-phosphate isomerase, class I [Micromonosporaceae bacterium]
MRTLHGSIRPYPWGSRQVIAQVQGRPAPSAGPEAELWLGAHPSAPSTVDGEASLVDMVAADPAGVLGAAVVDAHGARLPFLLKLLAAAEPLSLQAHPDPAQAKAGYAAGNPSYVDPYHKPELLVAVSEFEALCGFRAPAAAARLLADLKVGELAPVLAALDGPGTAGDRLRAAVTALVGWPAGERAGLVAAVARSAGAAPTTGEYALAARLAAAYPADPGVVVALLLNRVVLAPGEAIWMPAGNLHSYVHGTGIEIMAASDNVLRGGLTGKRVDVPELLRVLRFEVLEEPVVRAVPVAPGVVTWPVPVADFALFRACVDAGRPQAQVDIDGPRIAFCLAGQVEVDDGRGAVRLAGGEAAFGPAGGGLRVAGAGEVYVATTGQTGRSPSLEVAGLR